MSRKQPSKFGIRSVLNSRQRCCDITEAEFDELKQAKAFLLDYMRFEECVFQLLLATREYEEFILKTGLQHYLFPRAEFNDFQNARLQANLRVLGFMNSLTSLRHQFPIFDTLPNPKAPKKKFDHIWDQYKSDSVALRFCERVRNYAQHQTQPVSSVTMGGGWDDNRDLMETSISIFLDTKDVCRHRCIKKAEADEYLDKYGEKANISIVIRETAGVLGNIVKEVREFLLGDFNENADAYDKYLEIGYVSDSGRKVSAVTHHRGDALVEEIPIFEEFIKRARMLHHTILMTNNHKHFVSNRVRSRSREG